MAARSTTERAAVALVLAGMLAVLYRFSPPVPDGLRRAHCRVSLAALAGVTSDVNCDSPSFLELAADPARLLAPCRWQSRPLYVLSGTVLGVPFGTLHADPAVRLRGAYAGFIAFNLLALATAAMLCEALLAPVAGVLLARLLAVALLANDVVKTIVWSPHLQVLNVLQPVLLAWAVHHVYTRPRLGGARALGYAWLAGMAPLFYGSGFLLLPGLVLGTLSRPDWRRPSRRAASAALALAMVAVFVAPVVSWVAFAEARNGFFYSLEVDAYRQFLWIADRVAAHGAATVARDLGTALGVFVVKAVRIGWFPLALFVAACLLAAADPAATRAALRRSRAVVAAALVSLLLNFTFFWLVGYYTERLSLNVVPPLVLLGGVLLGGRAAGMGAPARRLLHAAVACAVVGWTAWDVLKPGPWSFHHGAWRARSDGVRRVTLPGGPMREEK